MKTTQKGNISVAKLIAALSGKNYNVLLPVGEALAYDLVIERDGIFSRVQVKTGRLRGGVIKVRVSSNNGQWYRTKETSNYHGKVEFFGIYCFENNKCYLVPIERTGVSNMHLRVAEPLVKRKYTNLNWATEFEM